MRRKFSLKRAFKCCITAEEDYFETSVKMHTQINEKQCLRTVCVKGLCGNPFPIAALIQNFSEKIEKLSAEAAASQKNKIEEDEEEFVITCKNETNSYYEFCKILSCEAYTLGKGVSEFIREFNNEYEGPEQLTPAIEALRNTIEQTVETLFSDYNFGRESAEKIMLYCRRAVEKYIFAKVYPTLRHMYKLKFQEVNRIFREKKTDLQNEKIYEILRISEEYRMYYTQALAQLNKLGGLSNPTEKLNCLTEMMANAKSEVFETSNGEAEIPINVESFIVAYLLLHSEIEDPMSEIMLLRNWEDKLEGTASIMLLEDAVNIIVSL